MDSNMTLYEKANQSAARVIKILKPPHQKIDLISPAWQISPQTLSVNQSQIGTLWPSKARQQVNITLS